jgi:hypothetical protein
VKHKITNGQWISRAPIGYRHVPDPTTGRNRIEVDHERAHLIRKMFLEYATGAVSLRELWAKALSWGVISYRGGKMGLQTIVNIIDNPFYIGVMNVKGKLHPHNHPIFIEKALWDECQRLRKKYKNPQDAPRKTRHPFLLRGMVTCATTGKKITCDLKKGKYVYLVGYDPQNPEKRVYVKEEEIIDQIDHMIEHFNMPDDVLEKIMASVRQAHETEKAFHHQQVKSLNLEANDLIGKLDRLTDLLMDGHITKEVYERKHNDITFRRSEINRLLTESDKGDVNFKTAVSAMIYLMSKTPNLLMSSRIEEKRAILGLLFSNLQLEGSTLRYTLRKPFELFVQTTNCLEWCREKTHRHILTI